MKGAAKRVPTGVTGYWRALFFTDTVVMCVCGNTSRRRDDFVRTGADWRHPGVQMTKWRVVKNPKTKLKSSVFPIRFNRPKLHTPGFALHIVSPRRLARASITCTYRKKH